MGCGQDVFSGEFEVDLQAVVRTFHVALGPVVPISDFVAGREAREPWVAGGTLVHIGLVRRRFRTMEQ